MLWYLRLKHNPATYLLSLVLSSSPTKFSIGSSSQTFMILFACKNEMIIDLSVTQYYHCKSLRQRVMVVRLLCWQVLWVLLNVDSFIHYFRQRRFLDSMCCDLMIQMLVCFALCLFFFANYVQVYQLLFSFQTLGSRFQFFSLHCFTLNHFVCFR